MIMLSVNVKSIILTSMGRRLTEIIKKIIAPKIPSTCIARLKPRKEEKTNNITANSHNNLSKLLKPICFFFIFVPKCAIAASPIYSPIYPITLSTFLYSNLFWPRSLIGIAICISGLDILFWFSWDWFGSPTKNQITGLNPDRRDDSKLDTGVRCIRFSCWITLEDVYLTILLPSNSFNWASDGFTCKFQLGSLSILFNTTMILIGGCKYEWTNW